MSLRVLIEATLEEAPRMMAAVRAAVDAQDATRLRLSAHTLKGAMRYFGETPAYQEAFHLENLATRGISSMRPTPSTGSTRLSASRAQHAGLSAKRHAEFCTRLHDTIE